MVVAKNWTQTIVSACAVMALLPAIVCASEKEHAVERDYEMAPPAPVPIKPASRTQESDIPWWKKHSFPNWVSLAAVLVLMLIPLSQLKLPGESPADTGERSSTADLPDITEVNRKLVAALIERSEFLMNAARQKPEYYKEALSDLLQAYQLEENNEQVLSYLAQVYEKLGDIPKAEAFFKKWEEVEDESYSEELE